MTLSRFREGGLKILAAECEWGSREEYEGKSGRHISSYSDANMPARLGMATLVMRRGLSCQPPYSDATTPLSPMKNVRIRKCIGIA